MVIKRECVVVKGYNMVSNERQIKREWGSYANKK